MTTPKPCPDMPDEIWAVNGQPEWFDWNPAPDFIKYIRSDLAAPSQCHENYKFVHVDDLIRLVNDAGEVWDGDSQMEVLSTEQEEQIEIAIRDYFDRPEQSQWRDISSAPRGKWVSDRRYEAEYFLAYQKDVDIRKTTYDDIDFSADSDFIPTHWQPLPQPPTLKGKI